MDFLNWIDPNWLPWVLPFIIFFSRIMDVSFGTLRIVAIARGMKKLAPILGFLEVFIWIIVVSQVIRNVNSIANVFAYSAGYATGNYVGMYLENKLAIGMLIVRIITRRDASELVEYLKNRNFGVTNIPAYGNEGKVNLIFTVIKRKNLYEVIDTVKRFNPRAFFSIEDVRTVNEGIFPVDPVQINYLKYFRQSMKRK